MSYKSLSKIFGKMCEIEIEIMKNDHMDATEAQALYDSIISLHVKFIETQARLIKYYDHVHEYYYVNLFDSIQQKSIHIAATLKKILQSNADELSPQDHQLDQTPVMFLREQTLFIKMIESMEWNNDVGPAEAEVLLVHLVSAYESFVCNQLNIVHSVETDSQFEQQMEISTDIQRKVTSLEIKLTKIIAMNKAPAPASELAVSKTQPQSKFGKFLSSTETALCILLIFGYALLFLFIGALFFTDDE